MMSNQHRINYKRFIAMLKQSPSSIDKEEFNRVDGLDVAKDV
jgi:hypothetical protein